MEMDRINKLKQEIEEYLAKDYCCEFKKECKDGVRVRCSEYEAKLYLILRFAEPREKRIAELEEKLFYMKKSKIALQDVGWAEAFELFVKQEKCIAEIEKENKNLKSKLNAINLLTPELEKSSKEKDNKLIKATELLKGLKNAYFTLIHEIGVSVFPPDVCFEVDKFLKEIE